MTVYLCVCVFYFYFAQAGDVLGFEIHRTNTVLYVNDRVILEIIR